MEYKVFTHKIDFHWRMHVWLRSLTHVNFNHVNKIEER